MVDQQWSARSYEVTVTSRWNCSSGLAKGFGMWLWICPNAVARRIGSMWCDPPSNQERHTTRWSHASGADTRQDPPRPPADRPRTRGSDRAPGLRQLSLRLQRIQGELKKLGIEVSATTISCVLLRHHLGPRRARAETSWQQSLTQQAENRVSCDFFTVQTVSLSRIYVLSFIELASRRVPLGGCTTNPTGPWMTQQARNLGLCQEGRLVLCASWSTIETASSRPPSTTSSQPRAWR
jgi:hypothetical protein